MVDGVIAALDAVEATTGEREVHGIGYCIGGTALSLAMGWLAARRQKQRVRSATLFTTLLGLLPSQGSLASSSTSPSSRRWRRRTEARGIMDRRQLAVSFSLLRRTASGGTTTSTATSRARARWHPICCTGTATAPTWRARSHSSLLRRLYLGKPAGEGELKIRHTRIALAKGEDPGCWCPPWTITSPSGREPGRGHGAVRGERRFILAESGHRRHHQSTGCQQIRLLAERGRGGQPGAVAGAGRPTRAAPGGPR